MKFVYNKKIELDSETAEGLRDVISNWANKIPHHDFESLGDLLEINAITFCPSYDIVLKTQYYSESVNTLRRPYKGEVLNYNSNEGAFKPASGEFISKTINNKINGTEQLYNCNTCKGVGRNQCEPCNGHGEVKCSNCNGNGKNKCYYCTNGKKDCDSCSGTGKVRCNYCNYGYKDEYVSRTEWDYKTRRNITVSGYVKTKCTHCSTTGKVRCKNIFCDYGQVRCNYCNGRGHNPCSSCSTTGKVVCNNCNGQGQTDCGTCLSSGKLVHYKEKSKNWYIRDIKKRVLNPIVDNDDFPNFKLLQKFTGKTISRKLLQVVDKNLFNTEPDYFVQSYKLAVQQSLNSAGQNENFPLLLHQQVNCLLYSIYKIEYTYENIPYQLLILDDHETVYEEFGPIESRRLNLKKEGIEKLNRKNYGGALKALEKAFEMDPDDFDKSTLQFIEKANKKIKSSYLTGAFIGSFIWLYFGTLISLAFLDIISSVFGISPSKYSIHEMKIIGVGFFCLTLVSYHLINRNKLAKWIFKKLGHRVSPEIVRITMGGLSSFPLVLIAMVFSVLLHQIGVIELIGKGLWHLFEIANGLWS